MKKIFIKLACSVLAGAPLATMAQAEYPLSSPMHKFEEGRRLFLESNFAPASTLLKDFMKCKSTSLYNQEAEYMLAVSAYKLTPATGYPQLLSYLKKYPETPYRNEITAYGIDDFFFKGLYGAVIEEFENNLAEKGLETLSDELRDNTLYYVALSYMEQGQLHEAATYFNVLENISTQYQTECTYYLSYIRYSQQRYNEALPGFLQLQGTKEFGALVPYYIADIYLINRNYDKAEIVAQNYLSAYPGNKNEGDMYRILGEAYYFQRRYADAISNLEKYIAIDEAPQRNALYELGMAYFQSGVYSKAASTLAKATQENDALSQNAYLHIGLADIQLSERNKARMAFEQAAAMNFNPQIKEQAAYNYALALHETSYSAFGESVLAFERFLNDYPNSPYAGRVASYLTEVYLSTRNYETALQSINRIKQPNAEIMAAKQRILYQLGTQSFANSNFQQACQFLDQSIALGNYNQQTKAEAMYWRGEAYYRMGNMTLAAQNLKQYIQQTQQRNNQMYALAHYTLGYIDFHNKAYNAARNQFTTYLQLAQKQDMAVTADTYNRLADCYLKERNFDDAKHYYALAEQSDSNAGAYAFYQLALVSGLQKDYSGKITILNRLLGKYPDSPYVADALYEKGRSYVQMENNGQAIAAYNELLSRAPGSPLSRKAAAEIGLLYYQGGDYNKAIATYKNVIQKYPGSEESRMAMADLKSIYVDMNRVDEYAQLAATMPGQIRFDASEQDSLSYIAAEKIYMRGRMEEAKKSFNRYLENYPEGAFALNTHYYLCVIGKEQKNQEQILLHSAELLKYPDNPYSEETLWMRSEVEYAQRDYQGAFNSYNQLKDKATTPDRRVMAKTGMLRSAYMMKNDQAVIDAATLLLQESKLNPELMNEAYYDRAKAYQNLNMSKEAMGDLRTLAKDTRNLYGAEAKYLVADQLYKWGHYDAAEKELLDYIDRSTPHAYWLARGFVLLSDVYMAKGQNEDARQYLLSLQQNYPANDDIPVMIRVRLEKLNQQ